jgi:hypothetical protein
MSLTDLDRFKAACVYPGKLDERAVERELAAFLQALGVRRRITRLRRAGHDGPPAYVPSENPLVPLHRDVEWILRECVKRNPGVHRSSAVRALFRAVGAARPRGATFDEEALVGFAGFAALVSDIRPAHAALAVRHASAALAAVAAVAALVDGGALARRAVLASRVDGDARTFAPLVDDPYAGGLRRWACSRWWLTGSTWELSWTACKLLGVVKLRDHDLEARLRRLFEAFVHGCWLLYWADDALYWVAKPTVHREPGTQRLHHDTQPALESDIFNLYFWQGMRVPAFVIRNPHLITIAHIDRETNVEVRRVMIERYRHGEDIHGAAAFIRDAGGERLDHDERYGTLWRRNIPNDEPIVMIEVVNRTREPDGRFKHYWLRVPPTMRTAREAVAWTFNMPAQQYVPEIET